MQCCPSGFSLNADRLKCESDEGEVEVDGINLCQGDIVLADSRYTSFSYYGGKIICHIRGSWTNEGPTNDRLLNNEH